MTALNVKKLAEMEQTWNRF